MTAQEVIKSFMKQLANHGYASSSSIGSAMLDSATRAASRYSSIQDVISAMKADQTAAEKEAVEEVLGSDYAGKTISQVSSTIRSALATEYNDVYKKSNMYIGDNYSYDYDTTVEDVLLERKASIFLEKYCGIILEKKFWYRRDKSIWNSYSTANGLTGNYDTGAITGSDAGGSTVKTKTSIVPETLAADGTVTSTFTREGLTVKLLGTSTNSSPDNITTKTYSQLTDDQKTIVNGLYKWWIAEGLKLNEESYGIGFNSSTANVKEIGLYFYSASDNTLAAVQYAQRDGDGAINKLYLKINMKYFSGIAADNVDGESTDSNISQLLDRTLAHELTHAIMEANINYFKALPQFIVEGTAELTHGIDDERGSRIFSVAANSDLLSTVLDVDKTGTGDANYYAGGYMFLRYFAKQAAAQTLPAFGEITATVNPSSGTYYISGNSTVETASTSRNSIKLGTVSNGTYTVENTGVHQVISNSHNLKIAGLTINDTLIGSSSADTVETAEGSFITSGKGNDSISIYGQFATVSASAGNDSIIAQDGSHHFFHAGDDDDFIQFNADNVFNNTIAGGAGDDSLVLTFSYNSSVDMGTGDDSIHFGGQSNTVSTGDGNDTIKFHYSNDNDNILDLGAGNDRATILGDSNTISGGEDNDYFYNSNASNTVFRYSAGDGNDLIDGFNSTSTLIIGGGSGTYAQYERDSDILLRVGNGFVTLRGAANLDALNVKGQNTNSKLIAGTANADTINNPLSNVTIMAYAGDDVIINSGSDVSINGGADNDSIKLNGARATVNVSAGNDTISFDKSIKSFTVEDFGAGDVIILNSRASSLESISGGIIAGSVTISGVDLSTTSKGWTLNDNLATYSTKISAGAALSSDSKSITYTGASSESMTVSGVGSTDGLDIDTSEKIVTVDDSALNKQDVTISDGYSLALGDVTAPTTTAAAWSISKTTATYKSSGTTAGYTLADNKISYTAANSGSTLVTVSGVGSTDGLDIDTSKKVVTVDDSALNKQDVTISNGYSLALGDVTAPTTTAAAWNLSKTTATYKFSGTTAGYTLADNKISYTAASGGKTLVTVSGVGSTDGLNIDTSKKVVTVDDSALNKQDVTISDGYTLALGDVTAPTVTAAAWNLSKTTATYKSSGTTAGYTLADNKISYTAASGGNTLVTVSGVGSTDGLDIDTAKKIVTVQAASLNETDVSISKGYSLVLGNDAPTPTPTDATWTISKQTATYNSTATTAGYTLADNKITYNTANNGTTLIELRGVSSAPTVEGNTVQLSKENFAKNVTLISGGGYDFELAQGNYSGKSFIGSAAGDKITSNGSSITIEGGAGNDTLIGGKSKDYLSGEDGDDILTGGAGNDTFAYSGGNDTITDYESRDKISATTDYESYRVSGKDLIFNFGDDNSLTIQNGASKQINMNSNSNYYTADGVLDKRKKSITLLATIEKFTADSKVMTIDGSATGAIEIIGNKKKNYIIAGANGSTINGGKGKDTLIGGAGADLFVYDNRTGKDIIEGFSAGDSISLDSDVTIKDAKTKSGDTVLKFKGGGLTVKDTTEFKFGETTYKGGVFITDDTAKVHGS